MITDKDLIRRALMGDQEAQAQCTEKEIVLPCPFCGGNKGGIDGTILLWRSSGLYAHKRTSKCVLDGAIIYNLADWNTRPAPPVGRCKDCKWYECGKEWYPYCNHPDGLSNSVRATDFCCCFEPKEE